MVKTFSVEGLGPELTAGVHEAFAAAGHRAGVPAEVVVVGVDPAPSGALVDLAAGDWAAAVGACRDAFFELRRSAASMIERRAAGRILVLVPVHALRTAAGCGAAAVAGSFLTTVAQVAAVELAPHGIRVNVVAVGPLEGRDAARAAEGMPGGRLLTARDVGDACVALASPQAHALTGAVVAVDGGYAVTKSLGGSPFPRG